ncbi:biotin--[acetyl-CoA-carboxylase] ligase [Brachybacterium sp. J153]|uniref:biotin--[acetyl-CoA-carboxylase] ligase n=1 Tax=Brachybacterium sp. J153 TaxID=3116488 RepID=UPI002E75F7C8|nr:biotin--[acetyl-CoA-carboxylase] ligase [Brachybacterium sp. J153]MEE1616862.1 biotin--[acetyl-CoA-carboxylase] ligase [Brachybacterium sp. J153]
MSRSAVPVPLRLGEVSSTQDEALRRLRAGERAPFALTATAQTAGRGRLGRRFVSPAAGLYLTYAHRTALPFARRSWIPHLAGLAALTAVERVGGAGAGSGGGAGADDGAAAPAALGLKWPNDLHTADGRKLGGILVEGHGTDHVLIGIGINVRGPVRDADGAEVPGTAWLRGPGGLHRAAPDGAGGGSAADPEADPIATEALVDELGRALAAALHDELCALESAQGDADACGLADRYSMTCLTLGRAVRVDPLGADRSSGETSVTLHGTARAIDAHGGLLVDLAGGGMTVVGVGDVRHLRADERVGPGPRTALAAAQVLQDPQDQSGPEDEHEEDRTR